MRMSFLLLFGVIAVYVTSTDAKSVRFINEDEANTVGQSSEESGKRNDTACVVTVKRSNESGDEHIVNKREISNDLARKLVQLTKTIERKKKNQSKKVRYTEQSSGTVSEKRHYVKKDKYDRRKEKNLGGRISQSNSHLKETNQRPPSHNVPGLKNSLAFGQQPEQEYEEDKDYDYEVLTRKGLTRFEGLFEIFRKSMKTGVDCMFDDIIKEIKKKIIHKDVLTNDKSVVTNQNTRSSCIDTGDDSCDDESESAQDTFVEVLAGGCSDASVSENDSQNVMNTRSDSSEDVLKQALPAIVKAAESVLGEGTGNKRSVVWDLADMSGISP